MKKRYYVYAHYNEDGKLFYIGKGTNGRSESFFARSKEWLNEAKDGFTPKIIADNLSDKQAYLIEQAVIRALEPGDLTNKKIPSDVILPYWKVDNKPQYHVHVNTKKEDIIRILENKIAYHALSQEELDFLDTPKKELDEEGKKRHTRLYYKRVKVEDYKKRLERAKVL